MYVSFRLIPALLAAAFGAPSLGGAQAATFASLAGASGLAVQRLDIDSPHSSIEFAVKFMGLSTVRGAFSEFGGTLMYDPADVTRSSIAVVIRTASINTNVDVRDRDLRSRNFFDAEKYPLITFTSTRVDRDGDRFTARGAFSMHGVTKEISIPFTRLHPLSRDAWGNQRVGFLGHTTLNRKRSTGWPRSSAPRTRCFRRPLPKRT